jgi:hypothetical protein
MNLNITTNGQNLIRLTPEQRDAAIREYVERNAPGYKVSNISVAAFGYIVANVEHALAQYMSPCPEGYDTVLGYLAKNHPADLEFMDTDPEATVRDGFWLTARAKAKGIKMCKVLAPEVLRKQGRHIEMVNAYPVSLLAERLG